MEKAREAIAVLQRRGPAGLPSLFRFDGPATPIPIGNSRVARFPKKKR